MQVALYMAVYVERSPLLRLWLILRMIQSRSLRANNEGDVSSKRRGLRMSVPECAWRAVAFATTFLEDEQEWHAIELS